MDDSYGFDAIAVRVIDRVYSGDGCGAVYLHVVLIKSWTGRYIRKLWIG